MRAINGTCYDDGDHTYVEPKLLAAYNKLDEKTKKDLYDNASNEIMFANNLVGYFNNRLISPEIFSIRNFEYRALLCEVPSNLTEILMRVYGSRVNHHRVDMYMHFNLLADFTHNRMGGLDKTMFRAIADIMPSTTTDRLDIFKTKIKINNHDYSVVYVLQDDFEGLYFRSDEMVHEPKEVRGFTQKKSKIKAKGEVLDKDGNIKHG